MEEWRVEKLQRGCRRCKKKVLRTRQGNAQLTQGLAVTDFHPRVPLDLSKETVGEVKKIL